jgi:SAM-dependent methyltransferase
MKTGKKRRRAELRSRGAEPGARLVFDERSPFIRRDNRRFRPVMGTSAELLNRRHSLLLPSEVVARRSVLDLGCALAATGKWVLMHGATTYTGVEVQRAYVTTARRLHADDLRAVIVCSDAQAYVSSSKERAGIVVLIGLLHGLYDPLAVLSEAARLAKDYVCVETFGDPAGGAAMTPNPDMRMPVAGRRGGSSGFGWHIAPEALRLVMEHLGFSPDMDAEWVGPKRYAIRYRRTSSGTATASEFVNCIPWRSARAS